MTNTVVIGMQWGDEGKGKIVDLLSPAFDAVVRFQGGDNAGHTVEFADRHFALHLIPSGILHPGVRCVLGNGMVINPEVFFEEVEGLEAAGVDTSGLRIARRAHVLLPVYRVLDSAREAARGGGKIGTTARGIGPAYEAKTSRYGLRMCDLAAPDLESRLATDLGRLEIELEALGAGPVDHASILARCREWAERLDPYLIDAEYELNEWLDGGSRLLFEGAQGTLLDLDHGTYPYVTSSSANVGGVTTGTGVPSGRIGLVVGVLKAYTTRVGEGPFTAELDDADGQALRDRGREFGTTTGRPRRCGWFDAVAARHSAMINGVDSIALTKADILDGFERVKICIAYEIGGRRTRRMPAAVDELRAAKPVWRELPGWDRPIAGLREEGELPAAARDYVRTIEEAVGAPVGIVSTGPKREETIVRAGGAIAELIGGSGGDGGGA